MQPVIIALVGVIAVSALVYAHNYSINAMVLKPHHSIDNENHVTGDPDQCSVMGAVGNLMYNDLDNDDIHDHQTESILCVAS